MKKPDESILAFIWQSLLFDPNSLRTTSGELIRIVHSGLLNVDQGPDFLMARLYIANTLLVGNVEIHVCTSDWLKHGHQHDPAYNNVILHVVWFHDLSQICPPHTPVLELSKFVNPHFIAKYEQMMRTKEDFTCKSFIHNVSPLSIQWQIEQSLVHRLEIKYQEIVSALERNKYDWELTAFEWMGMYLGGPVNKLVFKELALRVPFGLIRKERSNVFFLSAIFFGIAGFFEKDYLDEYPRKLKTEWNFLKKLYQLESISGNQLLYLRMRPAGFPGLRIAQWISIIHNYFSLFDFWRNNNDLDSLYRFLINPLPDYWNTHFGFDLSAPRTDRKLGHAHADIVIINAVIPVLFTYGKFSGDEIYSDRALKLYAGIKAENNAIIRKWSKMNVIPENSLQSQGLIELYKNNCLMKKCLNCKIGSDYLKQYK